MFKMCRIKKELFGVTCCATVLSVVFLLAGDDLSIYWEDKMYYISYIFEETNYNVTFYTDVNNTQKVNCDCLPDIYYTSPCSYEQVDPYESRLRRRKRLFYRSNYLECNISTCKDVPWEYRPQLTMEQMRIFLDLIHVFHNAMEKAGLTYLLSGGSALGAYRHHGVIPYDDDFDAFINSSEINRTKIVLNSLGPKYTFFQNPQTAHNFKLYSTQSTKIKGRKDLRFKWPYLDLFLFKENATHILTKEPIHHFHYAKEKMLPLEKRTFCGLQLVTAKNLLYMMQTRYPVFNESICVGSTYSHQDERSVHWRKNHPHKIQCSFLGDKMYPFVSRDLKSGKEVLKIGNKVIS